MNVEKKLRHGKNSDESDRISNSPDTVLQHILSFVETREAVRTSILSSSWRVLSESMPTLDLGQSCFYRSAMDEHLPDWADEDDAQAMRESVLRLRTSSYAFLDRALGSHSDMDRLNLYLPGFDLELKSRLDGWISGAVRRRVKELGLEFDAMRDPKYSFPQCVLIPKVITKLRLVNCELSSSCLVDCQLPCLRELCLEYVKAHDSFMVNLLASCPNLEKLTLKSCYGLTRLEIFCLSKLEKVILEHYGELVKVIKIEAPNLCQFSCVSDGDTESKIDVGACKNLKLLELDGCQLDDYDLADILNNNPMLERMLLKKCNNLYYSDVSSQNLVDFVLYDCRELQKVRINTPNLKKVFFYHEDDPITFVCKGPTLKLKDARISLDSWILTIKEKCGLVAYLSFSQS